MVAIRINVKLIERIKTLFFKNVRTGGTGKNRVVLQKLGNINGITRWNL